MNFLRVTMILGLILTGCGKGSSTTTPAVSPIGAGQTGVAPQCAAGQSYTVQFGCLSQGTCPAGYGSFNNNCVSLTQNNCGQGMMQTQYGCMPMNNNYQACGQGMIQTQYGCAPQNCGPNMTPTQNGCVPVNNNIGTGTYNGCAQGQGYAVPVGQTTCNAGYVFNQGICSCVNTYQTSNSVCPAGMNYTQYGCEPQGNCPTGQGWYNGACAAAANPVAAPACTTAGTVNTQFGCQPQSGCGIGQAYFAGAGCIPATPYASCPVGSTLTYMGCLPKADCKDGQVKYMNQCYTLEQSAIGSFSAGFSFRFHL